MEILETLGPDWFCGTIILLGMITDHWSLITDQVIDHGRVAPTLEAFQCHVGPMRATSKGGWISKRMMMILYNDDNDDIDLRLASPCIGWPLRSTAASTQLSLNWTGQVLMIMIKSDHDDDDHHTNIGGRCGHACGWRGKSLRRYFVSRLPQLVLCR